MQEKSVLRPDEIPRILSTRYGFSDVSVVAPLSGGSANLWTVSCDGKLENDYSSLLRKAENLDSEIRDSIQAEVNSAVPHGINGRRGVRCVSCKPSFRFVITVNPVVLKSANPMISPPTWAN